MNKSFLRRCLTQLQAAAAASCLLLAASFVSGCSSSIQAPASTSVTLTTSATSMNVGGALMLTSTLSGGSTVNKPIGAITFFDGTTQLQVITLQNGYTVSATIPPLGAGAHSITASYYGDPNNAASVSAPIVVNVYQPTSISLTAAPPLVAQGSPVTLTATITGGAPTGTVTFLSGSTPVGTAMVVATTVASATTYTATLTTSSLPLGVDPVTAVFGANGFFLTSSSNAVAVSVHGALIPTTLAVTASPTTSSSGTQVNLTANLTSTMTSNLPESGTVTFFDGSNNLGTSNLSAAGVATLSSKQFTVGSNSLTATYNGSLFYAPSTSPAATITITPYTGATYTNPLSVNDPVTGRVYNCPDPSVFKSQTAGVNVWYAYCTGDAFNSTDVSGGVGKKHLISMFTSSDLVHWTYLHDAFTALPTWLAPNQELQTPAMAFFNGVYHLYYYANSSTVINANNGLPPAIGVGTAATPAGPFVDSGGPVIPPATGCGGGCNQTLFSPEVIADATGQEWIVYGGTFGGILIQQLSATGLRTMGPAALSIGTDNLYMDPYIFFHNGYFYQFLSAGACCSGAISSLEVRVGRSTSVTGPYFDREGNDMNAYTAPAIVGDPGGDPVMVMNGNDIVGPGSNTMITDEAGQTYMVYSGVSQAQSTVPNFPSFLTARQLMMDPIDFTADGWPIGRGGNGPSDASLPQPVPAAQPNATNGYVTSLNVPDRPGTLLPAYSDDFNGTTLAPQWGSIHSMPAGTVSGGSYTIPSVNAESTIASSMATLPILAEQEPAGNYLLEFKMSTSDPATGYIFNYNSAGVFLYANDTDYLRIDQVPIFETRQVEFLNQALAGIVSFAFVGDPNFATSTYFRVAKRLGTNGAPTTYTSYSSSDGVTFLKGPTWTKPYGSAAVKIGLYAGNTAGYMASFDYVHVSTLLP